MSENKVTIIKEKIEIPKLRLWLIWLLLFVFPSLSTLVAFNYIKKEYRFFVDTDLIYKGFEEIKKYNEIIVPENYLEKQQDIIKKLDTNLPPEELKNKIDQILLGKTSLCIFLDKELKNVIIHNSKDIKNIPVAFFKKYFKSLLDNYNSKEKSNDYYNAQIQLSNLIQNLFNTVTPVKLSPNKTIKNLSILHGGELYFIFTEFEKTNNKYSYCFAVLKGKDFSYSKMINNLHNDFPNISIVFREFPLSKTLDEPPLSYCGIKHNNKELYIIAPPNLKFTRHVVYKGGIEIDKSSNNLFPFIKYLISTEKIKQNIKIIEKIIDFLTITILFISAIYFLYISLFNFGYNFKFKTKIIILTLICSIFPFSVLSIGIYIFENYNRFIIKTAIERNTEFELNFISKEIDHYLNDIETELLEFGQKISKELTNKNLKPSTLLDSLNNLAETVPLSKGVIYLEKIPNNLKLITSSSNTITKSFQERLSKESFEEKNIDLLVNLPTTIIPYINEDYPKEREAKNYFIIGNKNVESQEISKALADNGKLIPLDYFSSKNWFHTQRLYNKKNDKENNKVIGLLISKFEPRPILDFYFKRKCKLKEKDFIVTNFNYEIKYAFLPIENSGTASIWDKSGHVSESDKNLCLNNLQTNEFHFDNKTIISKINHNVPYLAIATIKEINHFNSNINIFKILLSIILYFSLILLFSSKLLDYIFVKPVILLSKNAYKIAKGSDDWNTKINSGDEFEELNNDFKHLVTGLKERNILKSYVSEDAFSDIEESSETNLKPGGEYIEATIVFSAIKDYDKLSLSITPKESIKLLSKFMSITEEVTKKYNGSIDKIIGDTIMLVFRHNPTLPSHALRAAKASLELVEKAKEAELPNLYTGIASGKVISGKIGSYSGKLDFTVIGNPVNSAARFKAESKKGTEKTGIIISGTTIGLTKGKAKVKFLRRVSIKGKSRMYNIYELVGIRK